MSLPLYQHPTMTVLVDDSASFLHSLRFQLGPDLPSATFSDPAAALHWLRGQSLDADRLDGILAPCVDSYTLEPQPFSVALRVDQVRHLARRARRFQIPSVLVVDYAMPQMDGIQFCEAVRDLPCRKIMLTGVADEKQAIAAFNRGLIDRFIRKSERDALDRLEADIASLQHEYFMARSHTMRGLLHAREFAFVGDPAIAALVAQVGKVYQIVEHYLFDGPPGFLMYDSEARPHLLVIETGEGMDAHAEMARESGAPPALVQALRERRVIPNFSDGDGMYSAAFYKDWYTCTAPAQECQGRELYYWAMFDIGHGVAGGPVLPFSTFLRRHQMGA